MIKITVDVSPMSHRFHTLMKLLDEDHYIYTKSIGHSEVNELTDLTARQVVYNFAMWLKDENFTNPDMSVSDWVNKYFNEFKNGKL